MKNRILSCFCCMLAIAGCSTPEKKARELISAMTIEEKASLMIHPSQPVGDIPAYNWWNEALHGVGRNGKATVFPMPIAMAASFDEPLVLDVFTAVSDEARVKHRQAIENGMSGWYQGLTFWTPNINIFRDPRWGRGMETYGEDPYLTGRLGTAVVRGLQGPSDAPVLKLHACAKHFAVHSGPEWSRHTYNAEVSERDLRETYLPAFKDLVTKADVQEVMIAYNRFRGVPCGASDYLINKVLRGEWGYKGIVLSDCGAISDFFREGAHGYAKDRAEATAMAIHAGTDLNCGGSYDAIPEAVASGQLSEADVDRSLVRLLAARMRLGELERDNSPWTHLKDDIVEGPEHLALSRKMAQESFVLLQNREGLLPLQSGQRVALVGPNADDKEMQWGNYNGIPEFTVTLREALSERIPGLKCLPGCGLVTPACDKDALLAELKDFDVVVFAGGISPRLEGEEMDVDLPGFRGGDRTDIELPQVQRELLQILHNAGKKVVLVNFSGSAMGLVPETESCDAILQAWYPGEEGGTALADVLMGDVSPSGKLPVTFYADVEQLPDFENYDMKGHTYRYFTGKPLYPFGYGLSYTTFEYGEACVKGRTLCVPVTNVGDVDAAEVVQLYVRLPADADGPLKSLRGFKRVDIPAGQTVNVEFVLDDETFLSWSDAAQDMVPVKGEWELMYGGNSENLKKIIYSGTSRAK
ncbi:MAG: glycoside hydrolase family 3 C-terminal domain-containing protein [Bacteroidales bacterium]|nr:glycoside hydrolase family 3 C-terminal domain-containing protein [Bacteroidales bacterium]